MRRRGRPPKLNHEQREYLKRVAIAKRQYQQLSTKRLAHELHVSERTVRAAIAEILTEILADGGSIDSRETPTLTV